MSSILKESGCRRRSMSSILKESTSRSSEGRSRLFEGRSRLFERGSRLFASRSRLLESRPRLFTRILEFPRKYATSGARHRRGSMRHARSHQGPAIVAVTAACTWTFLALGFNLLLGCDHDKVVVDCTADGGPSLTTPYCSCAASGTSGAVTYEGDVCNQAEVEDNFPTQCCATDGYPQGGTCACYATGPWQCWSATDICSCGVYTAPEGSTVDTGGCSNGGPGEPVPWVCCATTTDCTCQANASSCGDAGQVVDDCLVGPKALGIPTPLTSCPSGTTPIAACNAGPPAPQDSGTSTGDDSSGGETNPNACTSNGDCAPCGYCLDGLCVYCQFDLYGNCPC
jgi:hypothetical protein